MPQDSISTGSENGANQPTHKRSYVMLLIRFAFRAFTLVMVFMGMLFTVFFAYMFYDDYSNRDKSLSENAISHDSSERSQHTDKTEKLKQNASQNLDSPKIHDAADARKEGAISYSVVQGDKPYIDKSWPIDETFLLLSLVKDHPESRLVNYTVDKLTEHAGGTVYRAKLFYVEGTLNHRMCVDYYFNSNGGFMREIVLTDSPEPNKIVAFEKQDVPKNTNHGISSHKTSRPSRDISDKQHSCLDATNAMIQKAVIQNSEVARLYEPNMKFKQAMQDLNKQDPTAVQRIISKAKKDGFIHNDAGERISYIDNMRRMHALYYMNDLSSQLLTPKFLHNEYSMQLYNFLKAVSEAETDEQIDALYNAIGIRSLDELFESNSEPDQSSQNDIENGVQNHQDSRIASLDEWVRNNVRKRLKYYHEFCEYVSHTVDNYFLNGDEYVCVVTINYAQGTTAYRMTVNYHFNQYFEMTEDVVQSDTSPVNAGAAYETNSFLINLGKEAFFEGVRQWWNSE